MFVFLMFGTLALILFNCSQSLHLYLGYKEYFGMGIPGPDEIKSLYSVQNIGPSGVRALPLAAGINVVGHYFRKLVRAECVRCPWLLAET